MTIKLDPKSRTGVKTLKNLDRLTRSGIEYAAYSIAVQMRKTTNKEILRKPKGGKTYFIRTQNGARRRHVASAPYETHANMTGRLRKSLGFRVSFRELEFGYGVQVREKAPFYAKFVEFGTRKMAPRPSLKNGINASDRDMQSYFDREIGKRLEGRGGLVE